MIKLYHMHTSTCSKRVRITLAEKNLEWESVHIDLAKREQIEPDYVKLNPNGVVPTLIHGDRVLNESNVIIQYLDEVFPEPTLTPSDPYDRAQMRIWMDIFEHRLHKNINIVSWVRQERYKRWENMSQSEVEEVLNKQPSPDRRELFRKRLANGVSQEDMEFAEARIADVLDLMEDYLKNGLWLCGEAMSLADISVVPFIERFEANKMSKLIDWVSRPSLGDWWERMQQTKGYREGFYFPPPD